MTLPDFMTRDPAGYIHLVGHRVGLVDILHFYHQGDSPEMLHARFPTVALPVFYKTIAYYLENQAAVDEYCEKHAVAMALHRTEAPRGPSLEELRLRRAQQRLSKGA